MALRSTFTLAALVLSAGCGDDPLPDFATGSPPPFGFEDAPDGGASTLDASLLDAALDASSPPDPADGGDAGP